MNRICLTRSICILFPYALGGRGELSMMPEARRSVPGPGPVLQLPPGLQYRAVAAGAVASPASSAVSVGLLCSLCVPFLPMRYGWAFRRLLWLLWGVKAVTTSGKTAGGSIMAVERVLGADSWEPEAFKIPLSNPLTNKPFLVLNAVVLNLYCLIC